MIGTDAFTALAARLAQRAGRIAEAHGESVALARRANPRRWRLARLLWPRFTKG